MNILIIGCGYIGSAVANLWKQKRFNVTATTRSSKRLDELSKICQKSVILKKGDEEELALIIANQDVIIVTVAADSKEHYESAYLNNSKTIHLLATQINLEKHLIYTSSSSVYGDHHGQWVDESSQLLATSDQAKVLIETENNYLALKNLNWRVCIFRLTGIYGPQRELSRRVQNFKQTLAGNGNQYTNMIHKDDVVAGLNYALQHQLEGIYNLSDDEHPTQKELYDQISEKFHYPKVQWNPKHTALHSANKRVSNHKIKAEGFVLNHPHRILN